MGTSSHSSDGGSEPAQGKYALGYTDAEHDRLIRQAIRLGPYTDRLFRDSGIGVGQQVLDIGSGLGDVSMLLAHIVGPSGRVVGVERDAASIAVAQARVRAAGLNNVTFIQTEVGELKTDMKFDAVAGRFVLMFLPDPVTTLRSLQGVLRPGGLVVFQEPSWISFIAFNSGFALYSALLRRLQETFIRSGVNTEMGPQLYRVFQEAGLPAPNMHMEAALGGSADFVSIASGLALSLRPLAARHDVSLDELGDLETLPERIQAEVTRSNRVASLVALVGAWARAIPASGSLP
jgi:ubiquinone/menaquinone biosynthesis C-methylase UbiE